MSLGGEPTQPQVNLLLNLLPRDVQERLDDILVPVHWKRGDILYRAGSAIEQLYFPVRGMVSVVVTTSNGRKVEAATIGNEGLVGLPALLGNAVCSRETLVQVSGDALRVEVGQLRQVTEGVEPFDRLIRLYALALLFQTTQWVACNQLHSAEQRLCRWVLWSDERVGPGEMELTQQFLAEMLGVRRATVTEIALNLQRTGLIHYTRGKVTIQDRSGLEATSCECYRAVRSEYDRLLTRE